MGGRPGWRVDLKWFFGILSVLALIITVLLYDAYLATSRKHSEAAYRSLASQLITESDGNFSFLKRWAAERPDEFMPLPPGVPPELGFRGREIQGLSFQEFEALLAARAAKLVYDGEISPAVLGFADSDGVMAIVGLFNRETNDRVRSLLVISAIISTLLLVPLIIFSHGFGRLISLGIAISMASLPGLLATRLARMSMGDEMLTLFDPMIRQAERNHSYLVAGGVVLVAVGALATAFRRSVKKSAANTYIGAGKGQSFH